ncbi:MAG TPA: TetR/AcrR family transcriptional regulator [Solirubrobacterales bacterium]|nr:TetR/AcrR family transcriptional regulator [Solirubrobacterales bacterium]
MPTSMERRHNRRRRHERTRQELIEAALNQSAAGSFKDLTVEGVTREAGVARSAFYVYFGDKEELLLGALEDLIAPHQTRLGRCWQQGDDPRRDIERGIYGMARIYAGNSALLALAGEAATYDEEVRELWSTVLETTTEGTREEIERLQKAGSVNESLDPEALAEGLVLMTERSFQVHLAQGEDDPNEVASSLTRVWWATLFGPTSPPSPPEGGGGSQGSPPGPEGRGMGDPEK